MDMLALRLTNHLLRPLSRAFSQAAADGDRHEALPPGPRVVDGSSPECRIADPMPIQGPLKWAPRITEARNNVCKLALNQRGESIDQLV